MKMRRKHLFGGFLLALGALSAAWANYQKVDLIDTDSTEVKEKPPVTWKKSVIGAVTFTQTGFTNWAKGGENTITWNSRLDGKFRRNDGKWDYNIQGTLQFSQAKQEGKNVRNVVDRIDLDASLACRTNKYVNPEFGVGILTQFATGYDYKKDPPLAKSNFWDPVYLTQSLGAVVKVNSILRTRLGVGLKQTITRNFNQYSDNPATEKVEKFKFENGIDLNSNLDSKISTKVKVTSKLVLFSAFEHLTVIDVDWDTYFTAHLNKYLIVSLNVILKYDRDVLDKMQMRELASVGLTYNFM